MLLGPENGKVQNAEANKESPKDPKMHDCQNKTGNE